MFITVEGIEGSGKSTQANLLRKFLNILGIECIHTREPGGTLVAEKIRKIFLEHNNLETIKSETELLLMFAARSQHWHNVILPALDSGKYVICERFNDASFAYQGGGRGIDFKYINSLINLVGCTRKPDLVFLLDLDVELALQRIKSRGSLDRIEQEQSHFFYKIKNTYLDLAMQDPARYHIIDANTNENAINLKIIDILRKKIQNL